MTTKEVFDEASAHGITVTSWQNRSAFLSSSGTTLSWMIKIRSGQDGWTGFTCRPKLSGRKHGRKADVAYWCLEWAVSGLLVGFEIKVIDSNCMTWLSR